MGQRLSFRIGKTPVRVSRTFTSKGHHDAVSARIRVAPGITWSWWKILRRVTK